MGIFQELDQRVEVVDAEPIPTSIAFEHFRPMRQISVPDLLPLYGLPDDYDYKRKLGPDKLYEADPKNETLVAEELALRLVQKTGVTPDIILVTTSHLPDYDPNDRKAQRRANQVRRFLASHNLPSPIAPEDPSNTQTVSTACSSSVVGFHLLHDSNPVGQNVLMIAEETGYRRTLPPPENDPGKSNLLFSDTAVGVQFTYGEDLTVIASSAPEYEADTELLRMRTPEYDPEDPYLYVLRPPYGETFQMDGPQLRRHFGSRITREKIVELLGHIDPDFVLTHQASARMVDSVGILDFETARDYGRGIYEHGNTSSASIWLDLWDAMRRRQLSSGDTVLGVSYGAGLTWAPALIQVGKRM